MPALFLKGSGERTGLLAGQQTDNKEFSAMRLISNSVVPMYAQIAAQLEQDIKTGKFTKGDKLPTEAELSAQYAVSRITARHAIEELVEKSLVEKKQGKGTFVSGGKITRRLDSPMSFSEVCAVNGMRPGARVLEAELCVPGSAEVRRMLGLVRGESAVHIRRLRSADGKPLVLEDSYYPTEYAYLLDIDLEKRSIYRYLREEKRLDIHRTNTSIRIVRADAQLAKLLQVSRGAPQLEMSGLVVQADNRPVHTSYQIGYGENFEIIVR